MNEQPLYGILKHKERDSPHQTKQTGLVTFNRLGIASTGCSSAMAKTSASSKEAEVASSNKLLAGYMAHEYRTKGTVSGNKLGNERYKEITSSLMMRNDSGVHVPGVVNPTQLARWIQM